MTLSREEIETLLPFLANDTLEGEERTAVENAIANDPELQTELDALKAIRETMQSEDIGFSPGEMGLARLMRGIEAETTSAPVQRSNLWQIAAALLLAVAVWQGIFMYSGMQSDPDYVLAGDAEATFTIAINPDATEADLRSLLLDAGVEIVSGPSAIGLYGLTVLDGVDAETARATLAAATDIIETLESAGE